MLLSVFVSVLPPKLSNVPPALGPDPKPLTDPALGPDPNLSTDIPELELAPNPPTDALELEPGLLPKPPTNGPEPLPNPPTDALEFTPNPPTDALEPLPNTPTEDKPELARNLPTGVELELDPLPDPPIGGELELTPNPPADIELELTPKPKLPEGLVDVSLGEVKPPNPFELEVAKLAEVCRLEPNLLEPKLLDDELEPKPLEVNASAELDKVDELDEAELDGVRKAEKIPREGANALNPRAGVGGVAHVIYS